MKNGLYTSLADATAVTGNQAYGQGQTKVWFMKASFMRDGLMGLEWLKEHKGVPTLASLHETHVYIGHINLDDLEDVFVAMQGEVWSPNGEARGLIGALKTHTSMCVGDIIEKGGVLFLVDNSGFARLQ